MFGDKISCEWIWELSCLSSLRFAQGDRHYPQMSGPLERNRTLDESSPAMYNAEVIIVCMAWNRLLAYPVLGKDAKEF